MLRNLISVPLECLFWILLIIAGIGAGFFYLNSSGDEESGTGLTRSQRNATTVVRHATQTAQATAVTLPTRQSLATQTAAQIMAAGGNPNIIIFLNPDDPLNSLSIAQMTATVVIAAATGTQAAIIGEGNSPIQIMTATLQPVATHSPTP